MKILRVFLIVLFFTAMISGHAVGQPTPRGVRIKYNFNANWRVHVGDAPGAEARAFDDAAWKSVTVPYAWNEDDAFKVSIDQLRTGVAWYRKRFKLPVTDANKKVFLEFEGIRHGGEFYLNGEFIGRSENGIMAFGFDVTSKIKPAPQENVLAARIDSSWTYREKATDSPYQWNDRNFYANYGGINKNVYLHVSDTLYQTLPLYSNLGTTGVYVYADAFDIPGKAATITAEAQVKNDGTASRTFTFEAVIADKDGKVVQTLRGDTATLAPGQMQIVRAKGRVGGLNWWSWGYGYLYTVSTVLRENGKVVDTVRTRTGFRKTTFGHGMVKLNDRAVHLKGYAQRTTNEWPGVGSAVPAWISDFSNRLMVQSGANLVRWMHVTPWKQDVESCDRVGLMQALPAGDSEGDPTGRRWEQRVEVMRDAIIYNRNNPSIVFYESGNKGVRDEHMKQMKALRDLYDPHGGRASGSREMLSSPIAEWGGEMLYINKSARIPFWQTEYSRDEGERKYWDEFSPPFHKDGDGPLHNNQDARGYNRNQDSHAVENVVRWYDYWRERPGTGSRVNAGGVNIIFSDSNTHHRGAENYRTSGEVDALRLPKDGFFAHQAMWDGWVDVEKPRLHIIGHWNYAPNTRKPVYVVSGADKVELFVNNKSLGFGAQSHRFLFTFKDVSYKSGQLRAVGYDTAGKQVCTETVETAGTPVALRLTPRVGPQGLQASGADLALVDVEVVDAQNRRCPTALDTVHFSLTGPGEWRGGIAQGRADNFILSRDLPVENGVNRVIVRALPQAGEITVSASADGLKPATVRLTSQPAVVTDGLSQALPGAELVSPFDRGPTPPGSSIIETRNAVPIASAKAGGESDKAALSFDDDETTHWASGDNGTNAWIEYTLARPARVSEITAKLGGWRTKSYPVRVTVDGKQVWSGNTPQSLGYVTLTFPPTTGKRVALELVGATVQRDAFGNITEVQNSANAATLGGEKAKGSLDIVEIEIYEPVSPNKAPLPPSRVLNKLPDTGKWRGARDDLSEPPIIGGQGGLRENETP